MSEHKLVFAIYGNAYKRQAILPFIERAVAYLESHHATPLVEPENIEGVDYVISMGGDGTFLEAANKVGDREIPILGVNMGRLGFLADVLDGGGVGDVEAGAAGGVVEVGPDNFLVIVGQEPWVGGGQELVGQGLVVIGAEGVEVEAPSLLDIGRVGVDENVGGVGFHGGEEVEAVKLGDVDAVAEGSYVLDSSDEGRFVVAGVDLPLTGLVEAADGAGVEDAGSVGAVEVEGGEAEGEIVCLAALIDGSLVVPLVDGNGGVVDELAEGFGTAGGGDCAPERGNASVDVVNVDMIDGTIGQKA